MCLPILLFLTVAIVWLGFSVAGQSEVTITARNQAWRLRHGGPADNPQIGGTPEEQPFDFSSSALVTDEESKIIKVSPIFDSLPQPKSKHAVLCGSWDFTVADLNRPPNWQWYTALAASAGRVGLEGALDDLNLFSGNLAGQAESMIRDALQESLTAAITDIFSNASSIFKSRE